MPRLLKIVGCEKAKNLYTPKAYWKLMFFNLKEDAGGDFLCIRPLRGKNALLSVTNSNLSNTWSFQSCFPLTAFIIDAKIYLYWCERWKDAKIIYFWLHENSNRRDDKKRLSFVVFRVAKSGLCSHNLSFCVQKLVH